ncbi:DUF2846 domain-containing protein [Zhouia spongiae]|uniref:DUF2846 domain-containing protein n=1 Tax=Zhouia spongiae TaxID=2202721 RepID=A0ABY3YR95_9FLAO|nr:DUF2846 domain-containing protein [Zhouia spongiae]UNZ00352.1 DUF2846 domain-containing protein [Zhouia spongiae]
MKKIITLTLILISAWTYSQSNDSDYLVTVQNDTIYCKILELKNKKVSYIIKGEKGKKKKNIFKFADVHFADASIIQNPLNIEIEKPESGYAHVYFYRPYVYTGSALACKVEYNGMPFINIKTHSYYLHKVKAGEVHKYNQKNSKKDIIEINAKDGEIYYIRGSFGGTGEAFTNNLNLSNSLHIFQDNPKVAEYVILTMKKVSPKY